LSCGFFVAAALQKERQQANSVHGQHEKHTNFHTGAAFVFGVEQAFRYEGILIIHFNA
jgi:hypothetical protein